jgi:hypothetical protein
MDPLRIFKQLKIRISLKKRTKLGMAPMKKIKGIFWLKQKPLIKNKWATTRMHFKHNQISWVHCKKTNILMKLINKIKK